MRPFKCREISGCTHLIRSNERRLNLCLQRSGAAGSFVRVSKYASRASGPERNSEELLRRALREVSSDGKGSAGSGVSSHLSKSGWMLPCPGRGQCETGQRRATILRASATTLGERCVVVSFGMLSGLIPITLLDHSSPLPSGDPMRVYGGGGYCESDKNDERLCVMRGLKLGHAI